MPGIADKFTQSAQGADKFTQSAQGADKSTQSVQGRLLGPGMTVLAIDRWGLSLTLCYAPSLRRQGNRAAGKSAAERRSRARRGGSGCGLRSGAMTLR